MIKSNWFGYSKEHIGMIHWSAYWDKYSLVVDVSDKYVSELDSFGIINYPNNHSIRRHWTKLSDKDKFYTVQEFFQTTNQGGINDNS